MVDIGTEEVRKDRSETLFGFRGEKQGKKKLL